MGDTTMTEYTPTTDEIRDQYAQYAGNFTERLEARQEFRRWLAAHDAEVAANALREAAADVDMSYPSGPVTHRGWLRLRADRIEREATNHKPTPELGSPEDER